MRRDKTRKLLFILLSLFAMMSVIIAVPAGGKSGKVNAEGGVITGDSVYRESESKATVWFKSTVDGEIYYMVNKAGTVPTAEEIVSGGTKNGSATENTVITLYITEGMTSGPKNAFVVVKEEDGSLSNVLSFAMPTDVYYKDGFEGYYSYSGGELQLSSKSGWI
ncbi:MAG: hypothetical protein J5517_00320 [Eubacterium sp.]|nr:hypothetical protein [Eubacterium sp.]